MFSSVPGESGMAPLLTDTGSTIPNGMQQETLTVTQGGAVETFTIGGAQPGQTVVVTVGEERQTLTVGPDHPQNTGKHNVSPI
jgi:hypothetical protein